MFRAASAIERWIPARVIAFGFLATFMSSFGQTFFLGLFSPQFEAAAGIGDSRLGLLYGVATLVSGTLLFWLGGVIDRFSLPRAILFTLAIFITGSLLASGMTAQVELFAAFFLLRLGGQGLLTHLGVVAAARGGGDKKGSAIAWASMGVILGEAVLPAVVVVALAVLQWRLMWGAIVAVLALVVLPALLVLGRPLPWGAVASAEEAAPATISERRVLLRQPSFWAGLALLLAPPFMTTGFLFEQAPIGHQMHWAPQWIGAAFMVFAVCRGLGTWSYGRASDRFGAVPMARLHLLPMAASFASLALPLGAASIWVAFAGIGFTNGANSVLGGAVWVDLFGAASMGLVRGVFMACVVAATALAPIVVSALLSSGVAVGLIGIGFAVYAVLASLLVGPALYREARRATV